MDELEAWETLFTFALDGRVQITREMPINALRRTLAKVYQPRLATDDGRKMGTINACIDVVEAERDRRELCGVAEAAPPKPTTTTGPRSPFVRKAPQGPPWQPDPADDSRILKNDYTDLNYIRKSLYERATQFGDVEIVKAWAWAAGRFHKVISLYANDFVLEELGRALLYHQVHTQSDCEAVLLTTGAGRATTFRLVLLRSGRYCEDVSKYHLVFECEPDDPMLPSALPHWLRSVEDRLWKDRRRR